MSSNPQISIFDLSAGIHGRDRGIIQVIANNECFVSTLRGIARLIARQHGLVSCDDLREIQKEYGIPNPLHPNAWGAIFRGKEWEAVGLIKSKYPSNHARMIRTWRLRNSTGAGNEYKTTIS